MKAKSTLIFMLLLMVSCSKSDGNPDDFFKSNIKDGTWTISSFIINEVEMAPDYLDYVLKFKSNGKVTATKNSEVITGSWSINYEDSNSGDFYVLTKLYLNFNGSELFQKLNETWIYSNNTTDEIDVGLPTKSLRLIRNQ